VSPDLPIPPREYLGVAGLRAAASEPKLDGDA
jgi:hypothetical protein